MPASLATLRMDRPLQASLRFRVNSMRKRASAFSGTFSGPSGQEPPFSRCSFGLDSRPGRLGTAAQLRCSKAAPGRCHRTGIRPSANASTTIDNRDRPPLSRRPPAVEFCSRPAIPESGSGIRGVCPEDWTHGVAWWRLVVWTQSWRDPSALINDSAESQEETIRQGCFLGSAGRDAAIADPVFRACGTPNSESKKFSGAHHRYRTRLGATDQPKWSTHTVPIICEPRRRGSTHDSPRSGTPQRGVKGGCSCDCSPSRNQPRCRRRRMCGWPSTRGCAW